MNRERLYDMGLYIYEYFLRLLPLRKIIVFESQDDMDDNPRAFFDYLVSEKINNDYKFVWIVKDAAGCKKKNVASNTIYLTREGKSKINWLKLHYYLIRAKWFVFSHPWWFKKKRESQKVINVTHGIPFKGAVTSKTVQETFDYIIAPSKFAAELNCSFWHMPESKVIICGAPRNDDLFVKDRSLVLEKLFPHLSVGKMIICMPTFRQSSNQNDSTVIDEYCLDIIKTQYDFDCLDDLLRQKDIHLLIKPHPLQVTHGLKLVDGTNIHYINNQLLRDNDIKLYNLLGCCDALLTDFSSVFFDYLLLDRPIGFLIKNVKEYTRGFIMDDPESFLPGCRIDDMDGLLRFIDECDKGVDNYREERKRINYQINGSFGTSENCRMLAEWMGLKSLE